MDNLSLAVHFFLQIAVILVACQIVGAVAARFGQPQVVAEMIAGILLGPSLFGLVAPHWQQALFPWDASQTTRDTQSYLYPASQLGLALYMFVVGLEFRTDIVRKHSTSTLTVAAAGLVVPFLLGSGLAWYLHGYTQLFPASTRLLEAALFLGAALCVTALPTLARIVQHKGLSDSLVGNVSLGAGLVDDCGAWVILALALGCFDGDFGLAAWNIGSGAAFVFVAMFVVSPLLKRYERRLIIPDRRVSPFEMTVVLALLALSAWFTQTIQLHAVFGAFVFGMSYPRGALSRDLSAKINPLTVALLLPLFFTYSGLNTRLGELNSMTNWGVCGMIVLAAIVGKCGACSLVAKRTGLPNRDALGIGVLMNARGLMVLVIANVGLERGVISQELFTILVIMALVTTLMTSPLFDALVGKSAASKSAV